MQNKNYISNEDLEILKFLSKYRMLKVEDASLIYKTKRYYRQRVNKLINGGYVKRYKSYIILDKKGRIALKDTETLYIKNMDNIAYMERLKKIASIATITIDSNVEFIPSWDMKDRDRFTETARRYIGKIIIDSKGYLTYYIAKNKNHIYIMQLICDINKTLNYDNIIIFVDDFKAICEKYSNLSFGKENTYIVINSKENKEIIKKNIINSYEVIESIYGKEVYISDWDKADYLLEDGTYIIFIPFINTEKIDKINWYYTQNANSDKVTQIVTLKENEEKLMEIINSRCKIKVFDKDLLGGAGE